MTCADIIKVNEHKVEVITGFKDTRQATRQLHAWGVREVIVALEGERSIIYVNDRFYNIPTYTLREVVNATECGDIYSAGSLYRRSQGIGLEGAGKFAATMCVLKLEHNGPFDRSIEGMRVTARKHEK